MVNIEHIIRKGINILYRPIAFCLAALLCLTAPALGAVSAEQKADVENQQSMKLKDRLYEIEALINKKQSEIEQVKEKIESGKSARRINDEEYRASRKRLDDNEKKSRDLYEEKIKLSKTLKLSTDNLLRKKIMLSDRIKAAYKNSFRKKMDYIVKAGSFVDFYVNLSYFTRIIKFDTEFISDISKKVAVVKKQREELNIKIKELDLLRQNGQEYEKSLKKTSDKMGGQISQLYDQELSLKQELSVLFLEKERVEKQIMESAPPAEEKTPDPPQVQAASVPAETASSNTAAARQEETTVSVDISTLAFLWPLKESKNVLSLYGTQKDPKYNVNYFNSGIDISGAYGEEVLASADGRIKYKGEMKSVGKLIILDHGGNITSLYSHISVIEVGMGQKVKRGEVIGRLKEKAEASEPKPFLHFEIRINGNAKDPMDYL